VRGRRDIPGMTCPVRQVCSDTLFEIESWNQRTSVGFLQWFWFSLPLWALTSSPLHAPAVLAHVYLLGIKMHSNFGNENGNLNRKHSRSTCSSLPVLHLLSICFTNQNTAVFTVLGVGARRETCPCPTQFVCSWRLFICKATSSQCSKCFATVQRYPDEPLAPPEIQCELTV